MNPKVKWTVIVGEPKPAYWESYTKKTMPSCHKSSIGKIVDNKILDTKEAAAKIMARYECDIWNYHVVKYTPRLKK